MDLRRRLTGLLVDPKREWSIIAGEPADVVWLYRHFIAIVAAIPSAALFLRFTLAASPIVGLGAAVARYIIALAMPMAAAVVVQKLAPKFRSSGSTAQALKLVAYSAAPAWVAGVFYLLPGVGGTAALVGLLYGIYLFALGLPRLMHTPREQLVPFILVCALVLLVVNIVLTLVVSGSRAIRLPQHGSTLDDVHFPYHGGKFVPTLSLEHAADGVLTGRQTPELKDRRSWC